MRPIWWTCIVALALLPCVGLAQTQGGYAIAGAGAQSCGQYLENEIDGDLSRLYITWAQGFLSGMNVANRVATEQAFVTLPDGASIKAYLTKYCREHPLESPAKGTVLLFQELKASL